MARSAFRLPTLRTVGILGAAAGYAALAWPVARWLWPTPVGAIDEPAVGAQINGCTVARGRVDPSSIRAPLWLIHEGDRWWPVQRIVPARGRWQARICMDGWRGEKNRLALITADEPLDETLRRKQSGEEDEEPAWLKPHNCGEQGGCRPRRRSEPISAGATLLALVEVFRADGDDRPPMGPIGEIRWPDLRSGTDEGQRRRRHDERRIVRGRVGLRRAGVGGVPGAGDASAVPTLVTTRLAARYATESAAGRQDRQGKDDEDVRVCVCGILGELVCSDGGSLRNRVGLLR